MNKRSAQTFESSLTSTASEQDDYLQPAKSNSLLLDDPEKRSFYTPFQDEDEINEKRSFLSRVSIFQYFGEGTVPQAILSLVVATVGTGLLLVSNALAPSGAIWSSVQLLFCAWMSAYTLITLTTCANDLGARSYQQLALSIFGAKIRHVVNFCCFFANWGSAILFLQLSVQLTAVVFSALGGSSMPTWLTDPESKILIIGQATICVLPLCVSKELKALRYFCFANLIILLLFCYTVIYEGFDYQPITKSFETISMVSFSGFSTTFPSAVVMMTSHTNAIDIFIELKNPTMQKMKKVVYWTISFCFFICLIVGLLGYATFSSNIDILSSENYANGLIMVAYGFSLGGSHRPYPVLIIVNMITMCSSIIIAQPFNIKPAKDSFKDSMDCFFLKMGWKKTESVKGSETALERFIYAIITLYTCVLVVLYSESAQMVMNIVGGGFFVLLCFILPSLFYLKLHNDTLSTRTKITNWVIVVIGAIFAVWSTAENIIEAI